MKRTLLATMLAGAAACCLQAQEATKRFRPLQRLGEERVPDEVYVVDARARPGAIFQVVNVPGHGGAKTLRPVYERPSLGLSALACHGCGSFCLADANTKQICTTDGTREEALHSHERRIRDIAYDPRGRLFFSEATGQESDGTIYLLNRHAGEAEVFATVPLDQVGGHWAGHFAFDPEGRLFVSSGNFRPASLYELRNGRFVPRFTRDGPITGFAFADDHTLFFTGQSRELWKLKGFKEVSLVHEDDRVEWLTDVALVFLPDETPCRISGRLWGGEPLWPVCTAEAAGPNVFWRRVEGGSADQCPRPGLLRHSVFGIP